MKGTSLCAKWAGTWPNAGYCASGGALGKTENRGKADFEHYCIFLSINKGKADHDHKKLLPLPKVTMGRVASSSSPLRTTRKNPGKATTKTYNSYGDSISPPPGHADKKRAPSTTAPSQIEGSLISAERKGSHVVSSHARPASSLSPPSHEE
jgi:hypothetical protein